MDDIYVRVSDRVETNGVTQKLDNNDIVVIVNDVSVARVVLRDNVRIIALANHETLELELVGSRDTRILHYDNTAKCNYSSKGELEGKYSFDSWGYKEIKED